MSDTANTSESLAPWIGANAPSLGVILAALAIIVTCVQVGLTSAQVRKTAKREADNSEAQTRPYIGMDVVPSLAGPPVFDLVIENFGKTTARQVLVTLEGSGFGAQSEGDEIGPALGRLFSVPFDLSPTARRRFFWRMPATENATPAGDLGTPLAGELKVSYAWEPDEGRPAHHYQERLRYDLSEYPKLTPIASTGARAAGSSSQDSAQMKNLAHILSAIATHIGELRR